MSHRDIIIPEDLAPRLIQMNELIMETLLYSLRWDFGPSVVVQAILLMMVRVGYERDPEIVSKLHQAVDTAFEQYKAEQH